MKRIIILLIVAIFSFNACAKSNEKSNKNKVDNTKEIIENNNIINKNNEKKVLIVYFSLPENDDSNTSNGSESEDSSVTINGKKMGNTEYLANLIQEKTGGDIFRIETKKVYPINDHRKLIDTATQERRSNFRPELKQNVQNLSQYDTVFIGYPIWWADMPMALYTFLENNDLSGKTVIVFNTHGGSGLVGTVDTIKRLQPKAKVNDNAISIYRGEAENSKSEVDEWLSGLGY